ncbi:hypothetical protein Pint_03484 [Pistacia integerrima]|uniref:Uncharacterized protein n=1 Tax=Pistacia integerrima TaxID=434235 RepID=A0ACC0ZN59_9ROSI|nr:hypothetical protein Pint_03484 [Pistacia integerrima]
MRGTRRRGRQQNSLQNDDTWTLRPLNDPPPPLQEERNLESPLTYKDQTSEQTAQKSPKKQENPKWVSRNRRAHVVKRRFVKKSELETSKSELGSLSNEENSLVNEVDALNIGEEVKTDREEKKSNEGDGMSKNEAVDVESILNELSLSVEEPELDDEQLRINDQLQEDELLAMESIYGENVFILDRKRGLQSFQIDIHIEALDEQTVTAKLNSSSHLLAKTESSDDFSYSFKVQYLPPIVLTCLLPKSYPSHLPPCFTISVQWLDSAKISKLCSMLDSIWRDQPGQEIIYQWTDWLQNSSLSYVGFDKEIMLGPYGVMHTEDRRAIARSVSPDVDVPSIRTYNDERCHESFLKNIHECCICFSEYAGNYN